MTCFSDMRKVVARAVVVLADDSFCSAPDDDKLLTELLMKFHNFA